MEDLLDRRTWLKRTGTVCAMASAAVAGCSSPGEDDDGGGEEGGDEGGEEGGGEGGEEGGDEGGEEGD